MSNATHDTGQAMLDNASGRRHRLMGMYDAFETGRLGAPAAFGPDDDAGAGASSSARLCRRR